MKEMSSSKFGCVRNGLDWSWQQPGRYLVLVHVIADFAVSFSVECRF